MRKSPIIAALLAGVVITIAIVTGAGCSGGGGGGIIDDLCNRADECNFLQGVSQDECVQHMDQCTGNLTRSEREEWDLEIQDCLDRRTCGAAIDCYAQVPWC